MNDVLKTIDGEIDFFDEIKGESDTLAGLILEMKGNIPKNGEMMNYHQYSFTVESVDKTRVKRVKILLMNNKYWLLIVVGLCWSCGNNYTPKPTAFARIDFPKKNTSLFVSDCPFVFQKAIYSEVNLKYDSKCWFDLNFNNLNGKLHMSYKKLNNNLNDFTEDSRTLAYKHAQIAEAISEQLFIKDSSNVFGMVYTFQGNTATPMQFI